MADPSEAFVHLSSYELASLLQMNNARLWRRAQPVLDLDDDGLDSHLVLGGMLAKIVRPKECYRVLMAPKVLANSSALAENASAGAIFRGRAVSAQIGWLETCIPVFAAQAVTDVELFLSSGAFPRSRYIIS